MFSFIQFQNIYKLGTDGKELKASLVHNFEAGRRAIMNCAIHPTSNVLAVGMDNKCQLLELNIKEEEINVEKLEGKKSKVMTRKKMKKFVVNELQSKVTVDPENGDEKEEDLGFQKVVRFTADGKHIVTGGSDGHVKVLKVFFQFKFKISVLSQMAVLYRKTIWGIADHS